MSFWRCWAKAVLVFGLIFSRISNANAWGFQQHKQIMRESIAVLPPQLLLFYKSQMGFLTERATVPDKRRYVIKQEGGRHYIDLDAPIYLRLKPQFIPSLDSARKEYLADSLDKFGYGPWWLQIQVQRLETAFKYQNLKDILTITGELCHYAADLNVPLHTTLNYDGQLTGQRGIHKLWETTLAGAYYQQVNEMAFVKPKYLPSPIDTIFSAALKAHSLLPKVLSSHKKAVLETPESELKIISPAKSPRQSPQVNYHPEVLKKFKELNGNLIENQLINAVKLTSSLIFTAWVNAGQPDLRIHTGYKFTESEQEELEKELLQYQSKRALTEDVD